MIILKDYKVSDWFEEGGRNKRLIVSCREDKVYTNEISIYMTKYITGYSLWIIDFYSKCPFKPIYEQMYGVDYVHSTRERAIKRVDQFLDKLQKLKAFL
jgi:hypothetical protein